MIAIPNKFSNNNFFIHWSLLSTCNNILVNVQNLSFAKYCGVNTPALDAFMPNDVSLNMGLWTGAHSRPSEAFMSTFQKTAAQATISLVIAKLWHYILFIWPLLINVVHLAIFYCWTLSSWLKFVSQRKPQCHVILVYVGSYRIFWKFL